MYFHLGLEGDFRKLLLSISSKFIDVTDLKVGLDESMNEIIQLTNLKECFIAKFDNENNNLNRFAESDNCKIEPIFANRFKKMMKISEVAEINSNDINYYFKNCDGIKLVIIIPIFVKGELYGFLALVSKEDLKVRVQEKLMLKIIGEIYGKAFEHYENIRNLRESEIRYKTLANVSPYGIIIIDKNYKVLFMNNETVNILDLPKMSENINLMEIVSSYTFDIINLNTRKIINKDKEKINIKSNIETVSLKSKYLDISMTEFKYSNENAVLIILNDITIERQREEDIKKFYRVLKQIPEVVIIVNDKANIEYMNNYFSEKSNIKENDLLNKNIKELKDYKLNALYEKINDVMEVKKAFFGEIYMNFYEPKYFLGSISPLRNESHEITHYVCILKDINEQKIMQEELKEKNESFKIMIGELKDAQAQLIQKEKLAGIGQLAAGVAHEINNPLGFVISNYDTLKKYIKRYEDILLAYKNLCKEFESQNTDQNFQNKIMDIKKMEKKYGIDFIIEDMDDLISDSKEGLDRVGKIVQSLKYFSRDAQYNEFESYDINEGIENTILIAKNEVKYSADIELHLNEVPLIDAISGQINQVILNIIINAVQAIKETKEFGVITIKTYKDSKYVFCEIQDNAKGIDEEVLDNIFEPFFTTKEAGVGTGLGLSIAYDIITNKHKGSLFVESKKGEGTTFIIMLPIKQG
ncbi:ATP-binding protein [Peptostreptococcaceae bacterium AGR-M142]